MKNYCLLLYFWSGAHASFNALVKSPAGREIFHGKNACRMRARLLCKQGSTPHVQLVADAAKWQHNLKTKTKYKYLYTTRIKLYAAWKWLKFTRLFLKFYAKLTQFVREDKSKQREIKRNKTNISPNPPLEINKNIRFANSRKLLVSPES